MTPASGAALFETLDRPPLELAQQLLVREVELQRRHRDEAIVDRRIAIAAGNILVLILAAADPVVLAAARVHVLHHVVAVGMLAEPGDGVTRPLNVGWNVDVEKHLGRRRILERGPGQLLSEFRRGPKVESRASDEAEGDGRNAEQRGFD